MLYPKDPSIELERGPAEILFRWRRRATEGIAMALIGLLCLVGGFFIGAVPLQDGTERSIGERLGFIGMFALFGAPMLYYGLALMLTWNRIRVDGRHVRAWSAPLPLFIAVTKPVEGVQQFFAVTGGHRSSSSSYLFNALYLMDRSDHVWKVVGNLPSAFAANQLAHELNDFLGLEDKEIYGVTTDPAHPGPRQASS